MASGQLTKVPDHGYQLDPDKKHPDVWGCGVPDLNSVGDAKLDYIDPDYDDDGFDNCCKT